MEKQRKAFGLGQYKTREEPSGEKYIEGYFAVFGQETEIWTGWYEQIAPGAFKDSLLNNDIRCLFNHDHNLVMGRNKAGTLSLREDDHGLWGSVRINQEDSQALDIYARVKRGDITGCSFAFNPTSEEYSIDDVGNMHWIEKAADLLEVSICPFPAYPQTEIQARQQQAEATKEQITKRKRAALREKLEGLKC